MSFRGLDWPMVRLSILQRRISEWFVWEPHNVLSPCSIYIYIYIYIFFFFFFFFGGGVGVHPAITIAWTLRSSNGDHVGV